MIVERSKKWIVTKLPYTVFASRKYELAEQPINTRLKLPAGTRVLYVREKKVRFPTFPDTLFTLHRIIFFDRSNGRITNYLKDRLRPETPLYMRYDGEGVEVVEVRLLTPGGPQPQGPSRASVLSLTSGELFNVDSESLYPNSTRLRVKEGGTMAAPEWRRERERELQKQFADRMANPTYADRMADASWEEHQADLAERERTEYNPGTDNPKTCDPAL